MSIRTSHNDTTGRLPPGQTLTTKWPVLHCGDVPELDPRDWQLRTDGAVAHPLCLGWSDLMSLPRVERTSDFHCVTTWSRLDNPWEGVLFRTLAEATQVQGDARFVMAHSYDGYTTNLALADLYEDDVLIAWAHDHKPLSPEHGGPVRLVVPKRYAWKSAKWLSRLEFLTENRRGFWEERGYHNRGEPFAEERYSYQETE